MNMVNIRQNQEFTITVDTTLEDSFKVFEELTRAGLVAAGKVRQDEFNDFIETTVTVDLTNATPIYNLLRDCIPGVWEWS
jgi:hypothetical protein